MSEFYLGPMFNNVCNERFDRLENEIKELKRFQDITHEQYKSNDAIKKRIDDLEDLIYEIQAKHRNCNKKPYKCPLCDGLGYLYRGMHRLNCDACSSNGIIWG